MDTVTSTSSTFAAALARSKIAKLVVTILRLEENYKAPTVKLDLLSSSKYKGKQSDEEDKEESEQNELKVLAKPVQEQPQ